MGAFRLLTSDLLDTSRQQFDFTQSLTDTIGNLGTDADGFDALVAETIDLIDTGIGVAGALDADLGSAVDIAGTIDPNSLNDVATALPGMLAEGDAILQDVTALVGAVGGAPTPPTGPPGSPQSSCATQDFGNVNQGNTATLNISIQNNGNGTIVIKSMVIAGDPPPNIFSYSPNYSNKSIAPGSSLPLTLECDAVSVATPGQYTSTLTVNTDQPDPQPCITLQANVVGSGGGGTPPGPPSGGGGGGGGGGCDVGFDQNGKLGCID